MLRVDPADVDAAEGLQVLKLVAELGPESPFAVFLLALLKHLRGGCSAVVRFE